MVKIGTEGVRHDGTAQHYLQQVLAFAWWRRMKMSQLRSPVTYFICDRPTISRNTIVHCRPGVRVVRPITVGGCSGSLQFADFGRAFQRLAKSWLRNCFIYCQSLVEN